MQRDDMAKEDALERIAEAKADLMDQLDSNPDFEVDEFMSDWFGLEPDYFEELL
jgi:hypothetical protein